MQLSISTKARLRTLRNFYNFYLVAFYHNFLPLKKKGMQPMSTLSTGWITVKGCLTIT